ncbi:MAG: HAMP domain-containing histidine kinase [Oscillospiraceae bacterium]|nr:HAMP domain-containing histidine kinase [Oscillospiraceae bacterium]
MLKKLRWRVVSLIMAVAVVCIAIISVLGYTTTRQSLEQQSHSALENILSGTVFGRQIGGPDGSNIQFPYFTVFVYQFNNSFSYETGDYDIDSEQLTEIVNAAWSFEGSDGVLEEYQLRYQKRETPGGTRIAFVDTSIETSMLKTMMIHTTLLGLGAIAVFFILSMLISKQLLKPVAEAWDKQRQFVADASHELKTPLTVIMANTALMQSDPDRNSEANTRRIENIRVEGEGMRHLVETLLDQARMDSGEIKKTFSEVDLSYLVMEAVMLFEPVIYECGREIRWEVDDGVTVMGDAEALRRLLTILLDNARKYSDEGSEIFVSLHAEGHKNAALTVSDKGAEMSKEECERIFTRFYRADTSHTANGSYGLGLSIARSTAEAHGGTIRAESAAGTTKFIATLPTIKKNRT